MLILSAFIVINAGVIYGISQVYVYLNTGADRYQILHLDVVSDQYYTPDIKWSTIENPGRPLEPFNQQKIEKDYLDAWYIRTISFKTGGHHGIEDHYTSKARQKLYETLEENNTQEIYIEATTLTHDLSLEFYSADGTLVVLTDRNVSSFQRVFKKGQLYYQGDAVDDYRIIMLLEDGFWRIRHLEKIAPTSEITPSQTSSHITTSIAGINYYPQENPWNTFGDHFDTETLQKDFQVIKDLHLNTIRIFIGYEDFGNAQVSPERLEKLIGLLDVASQEGLEVIVTLFDFYGNYEVSDWTRTQRHLLSIATAIKNHPALLAWDIKNEPDLDFEQRGEGLVLAWLQHSITTLRSIDQKHPITIGWSSPDVALFLEKEVDYISFHYYKNLKNLSQVYTKLKAQTPKQIVLEEFGMSSYRGLWNPFGYSEKDQAQYYRDFLEIQKRDSLHYLSWTLYDFREIPNNVSGAYPWRKNKQAYFGLIDIHGVKDDAYSVLKNR